MFVQKKEITKESKIINKMMGLYNTSGNVPEGSKTPCGRKLQETYSVTNNDNNI